MTTMHTFATDDLASKYIEPLTSYEVEAYEEAGAEKTALTDHVTRFVLGDMTAYLVTGKTEADALANLRAAQ